MMKYMTRVGDIFQIPIDENRVGFGQIMARKLGPNPDLMVVFERVSQPSIAPSPTELSKIVESSILFIANTFDVLIRNGRWKNCGNLEPNLKRVPLPCYKLGSGHFGVVVESYDRKRRRRATKAEIAMLDYRNSIGPIRLEKALQAKHGVIPWKASFEKLTFDHIKLQSQCDFRSLFERVLQRTKNNEV